MTENDIDITLVGPVGRQEIAQLLDVSANTVNSWIQRGILPPPACHRSGTPLWEWAVVKEWARETDRI